MVHSKYQITFGKVRDSPTATTEGDYDILAQFLMYWDKPSSIIKNLIPCIDRGIKYGTKERFISYEDFVGLKEKMFDQWSSKNNLEKVEYWEKIRSYKGYYIEEENSFLEGVGADVVGFAFVTADKTYIGSSKLNLKSIEISSEDFKKIVSEWLCFILENC